MLTKKGGSALRDIPSAQNRLFRFIFKCQFLRIASTVPTTNRKLHYRYQAQGYPPDR